MPTVAIVHDYLTQRGGAERVVLSMHDAFPDAVIYTSLYERARTFEQFGQVHIATSPLNAVPSLRRSHRWALPLLAWSFSRLDVRADVVLCSSTGWAHGVSAEGRKVVYCHSPAKWLYQPDRYLARRKGLPGAALAGLRRPLTSWDQRAASSADRYLVNSSVVSRWVQECYRRDAEVLPPPYTVDPAGPRRPLGVEPGYLLCVSRLLGYKNIGALMEAFRALPGHRLVIAGAGPDERLLRSTAPSNVTLLGPVGDDELRWLYANCLAVVTAAFEDFGLTPLEAAAFGKPVAVLRWGGFLDTVVEGETGLYFERPEPAAIAATLGRLVGGEWRQDTILAHAQRFSPARFVARLRTVVAEEARRPPVPDGRVGLVTEGGVQRAGRSPWQTG